MCVVCAMGLDLGVLQEGLALDCSAAAFLEDSSHPAFPGVDGCASVHVCFVRVYAGLVAKKTSEEEPPRLRFIFLFVSASKLPLT